MTRSLLAIASFLFVFAALELALRWLPANRLGYDVAKRRFVPVREFERDRTKNRLGFHDVEHEGARAGRSRLFLLGDSYVAATSVSVAESVGQQLERALERQAPPSYEVLSLGRSAWGQRDQLEKLRELAPAFAPRVVVTLFLGLNDVRDDSPELQRRKRENDRALLRERPGWVEFPFERAPALWLEGSALNRFLSYRLALWRAARRWPGQAGETGIPFDYFVYRTRLDDAWKTAWREKEELIQATAAYARREGARYLIVSASTPHGVWGPEEGLARLMRAYPAMRAYAWDLDRPDRLLAEICERHAIPLLRLEPPFRELTRAGARLHWPYDGHWNAEGNHRAGERIASFVAEQVVAPAL